MNTSEFEKKRWHLSTKFFPESSPMYPSLKYLKGYQMHTTQQVLNLNNRKAKQSLAVFKFKPLPNAWAHHCTTEPTTFIKFRSQYCRAVTYLNAYRGNLQNCLIVDYCISRILTNFLSQPTRFSVIAYIQVVCTITTSGQHPLQGTVSPDYATTEVSWCLASVNLWHQPVV